MEVNFRKNKFVIGASLSEPQYCRLSWYVRRMHENFLNRPYTVYAYVQEDFVTWTLRWKERRDLGEETNVTG